MKEIAEKSLTNHFAIVETPDDEQKFWERQRFLRNHKVRPIWYPHGQHGMVEEQLRYIVSERECLAKIYGPERKIAVVFSHLTMAPELSRYIDRDAARQAEGDGGQESRERFFQDEEKRNSIKKYFLVPGNRKGDPLIPGEGQQKCRGTKVACVCEVRAAAYLSSSLAKTEFMNAAMHADHELTRSERSRIYLGVVSNPGSWTILKENPLVRLNGLIVDRRGNVHFALATGEPLHDLREMNATYDAEVDYGIILRFCSQQKVSQGDNTVKIETIRSIVCAGLGEFGTSGAAFYLANHFQEIAGPLKSSETNFVCLIRVPGEDDSQAEMVGGVPFEENESVDIQAWRSNLFDPPADSCRL